jgi:hypothetical protein
MRNMSGGASQNPPLPHGCSAFNVEKYAIPGRIEDIETPEEPLFATSEQGYGYFYSAACGRGLSKHLLLRKAGFLILLSLRAGLNPRTT